MLTRSTMCMLSKKCGRAVSGAAAELMAMEERFGAFNYKPMPVVLAEGRGAVVRDVEGREYLDFLSAYSAVNQGHSHPRILAAMTAQAKRLALTSRAFHNDRLGPYERYMTQLLGMDRLLPMNSGVEACESSVKLARRWAYDVKKVPRDSAVVIFARQNFWGRSIAAVSASTDPTSRNGFGPFLPGVAHVPFNDLIALEEALKQHPTAAAFMVEPVQGEAGVVVPDDGYLRGVRKLCDQYKALFIADEVQTGLGRTGKMLACDHEAVRPDLLVLGKALSGGFYPVSAVLGTNEVMTLLKPGEHGSTFGGNPLACAIAMEAVQVIVDERLPENAERMGALLRKMLSDVAHPDVLAVRGKGLLSAAVIRPKESKTAWDVCVDMMHEGVLAKPTQRDVIRFAPPLIIDEGHVRKCADAFRKAMERY